MKSICSAKLQVALCLALALAPAYGDSEEALSPARPPLFVRCALSLVELAKEDLTHLKSGRVPLRTGLLFTVVAGFGVNYLAGVYHRNVALEKVVHYGHLANQKLEGPLGFSKDRDTKELSRIASQAYQANDRYFAEFGRTHSNFAEIRDAFFWQLDAPAREARFRHWEEHWTQYDPIPPFPPTPSTELFDEAANYHRRTANRLIAEIGRPHPNLSPKQQNDLIANVLANLEPAFWEPDDLKVYLSPAAEEVRNSSIKEAADTVRRLRQMGLHGVIKEKSKIWVRDYPTFQLSILDYKLSPFFEKEALVHGSTLDGSALLDWITDELLPTFPERVRAPLAAHILVELEHAEAMQHPNRTKGVGIKLPDAESVRRLLESISISEATPEWTSLQTSVFLLLGKLTLSNTEVDFFAGKLSQNPSFARSCKYALYSERPTFLAHMFHTVRGRQILHSKILDSKVLTSSEASTIRARLEQGEPGPTP